MIPKPFADMQKSINELFAKINTSSQILSIPLITAPTTTIVEPLFSIGDKPYLGKQQVYITAVHPADKNYPNSQHVYYISYNIGDDIFWVVDEHELSMHPKVYSGPKCTCGSTTTYGMLIDTSVHSFWCDSYAKGGLK